MVVARREHPGGICRGTITWLVSRGDIPLCHLPQSTRYVRVSPAKRACQARPVTQEASTACRARYTQPISLTCRQRAPLGVHRLLNGLQSLKKHQSALGGDVNDELGALGTGV